MKKYIVTLNDNYLEQLYAQANARSFKDKYLVLHSVLSKVKDFLYGDLNMLVNFKINGQDAINIRTLSGVTLKDLRKKGKKIRIV